MTLPDTRYCLFDQLLRLDPLPCNYYTKHSPFDPLTSYQVCEIWCKKILHYANIPGAKSFFHGQCDSRGSVAHLLSRSQSVRNFHAMQWIIVITTISPCWSTITLLFFDCFRIWDFEISMLSPAYQLRPCNPILCLPSWQPSTHSPFTLPSLSEA